MLEGRCGFHTDLRLNDYRKMKRSEQIFLFAGHGIITLIFNRF